MSISITLSDQASPLLARIRTAADAGRLSLVGARAVAGQVREHFLQLQEARHRPGRGDSFYGRAARSVSTAPSGPASAVVGIAQRGVRLRRLGGIVRPKAGRKLIAYPADDAPREAFERGPTYFADLDLERVVNPAHGGLQLALVRRASTPISLVRRKAKDGTVRTRAKAAGPARGGEVVFWLARKTTHQADPSVLPAESAMQTTFLDSVRLALVGARPGSTP